MSLAYRYSRADTHYKGTAEQTQRQDLGNNVVNIQNLVDLRLTYAITDRWSVTASIPYFVGSWSIPLPTMPPGPRYRQESSGIGDIIFTGKYWVLDPHDHPHFNVQIGLGVKLPTGNDDQTTLFPDFTGANLQPRNNDVSIQPGDGGWGITTEFFAFKDVGDFRLFASGIYLLNPREQNGVLSLPAELKGPMNVSPNIRYNSVPDQYQAQIGASAAIPGVKNLSGSLALRIDGVTVNDLIGNEAGWRRPGFFVSLVPGLAYHFGKSTVNVAVSITLQRERQKNAYGNPGDATFADWAFFLGWTYRF